MLTVAGALDSAGERSASSYIAELRLRHVELDFAISPTLDRAFKKAPEVRLSAIKHDTDTLIVGSADACVISLHWLLRADEAEGLSLEMTSLFLHEGMSGPGDVTLQLPTSKTDPRGNGASKRLTCICKLPIEMGDILPEAFAPFVQVTARSLVCTRFPRADGSRASKVQLVQHGAWPLRRERSLRGTARADLVPNVTLDKVGPCG